MKKLLITGANGFVAKFFVEYLKTKNIEMEILGLDIAPDCQLGINYLSIDLTKKTEIFELLRSYKPDYIMHLASISSVSQSWKMPVESFVNNTNIFLNLIESIRQLELKTRVLSVGSSEEYGDYKPQEMPLKESFQLKPNNPYSVARVSQEMLSKLYADSYGLDIVMTRSFNHIGPGQRDIFVVSSFVKQLVKISQHPEEKIIKVGNINVVRDFLDVRDVVDAYYKLLINGEKGSVYNVCSSKGTKLEDLIKAIANILKIEIKIEIDPQKVRPNDSEIIIGDNTKLMTELGWRPKYSLKETFEDMVDFWREKLKTTSTKL